MSKKSRMKKRMETKVENKPVTDEQTEAVEQTEMPVETQQAEVTEETEAVVSAAELAAAGVKPDLMRLSVGLEDIDDILADLERGFAAVKEG